MAKDSRRLLRDIHGAPWLLEHYIHINNPEKVVEKINNIIRGGRDKLQVIFDFDQTLIKHQENGVRTKSSFSVLESMPAVPDHVQQTMTANYKKYFPIETDPRMSVEEKIPHMLDWWEQGIELLKGVEWDPVSVDNYLRQNKQPFRNGTTECFQQLCSSGVPVLIFSAGIGDVVKPLLSHQGLLTPNVHVFSNFLKIENGRITGSLGNIIHVFNKNEQLLEHSPYFEELTGRNNVILLGDSIGDSRMADGVPHDVVLKIGFLNAHIEESLAQYKEVFDIVLADDQTMDVLNSILKPTL